MQVSARQIQDNALNASINDSLAFVTLNMNKYVVVVVLHRSIKHVIILLFMRKLISRFSRLSCRS
jgi:hypothetical protein